MGLKVRDGFGVQDGFGSAGCGFGGGMWHGTSLRINSDERQGEQRAFLLGGMIACHR